MSKPESLRVFSGRAEEQLLKLHRAVTVQGRAVDQSLSRLVGTLHACNLSSQQEHLDAYLTELVVMNEVLRRLQSFLSDRQQHVAAAIKPSSVVHS